MTDNTETLELFRKFLDQEKKKSSGAGPSSGSGRGGRYRYRRHSHSRDQGRHNRGYIDHEEIAQEFIKNEKIMSCFRGPNVVRKFVNYYSKRPASIFSLALGAIGSDSFLTAHNECKDKILRQELSDPMEMGINIFTDEGFDANAMLYCFTKFAKHMAKKRGIMGAYTQTVHDEISGQLKYFSKYIKSKQTLTSLDHIIHQMDVNDDDEDEDEEEDDEEEEDDGVPSSDDDEPAHTMPKKGKGVTKTRKKRKGAKVIKPPAKKKAKKTPAKKTGGKSGPAANLRSGKKATAASQS